MTSATFAHQVHRLPWVGLSSIQQYAQPGGCRTEGTGRWRPPLAIERTVDRLSLPGTAAAWVLLLVAALLWLATPHADAAQPDDRIPHLHSLERPVALVARRGETLAHRRCERVRREELEDLRRDELGVVGHRYVAEAG